MRQSKLLELKMMSIKGGSWKQESLAEEIVNSKAEFEY